MTTFEDKAKADKEFVSWCEENGFPLSPIQKVILSHLPFNGGTEIKEPFVMRKV